MALHAVLPAQEAADFFLKLQTRFDKLLNDHMHHYSAMVLGGADMTTFNIEKEALLKEQRRQNNHYLEGDKAQQLLDSVQDMKDLQCVAALKENAFQFLSFTNGATISYLGIVLPQQRP